jgi:hypothetical protein
MAGFFVHAAFFDFLTSQLVKNDNCLVWPVTPIIMSGHRNLAPKPCFVLAMSFQAIVRREATNLQVDLMVCGTVGQS